MKKSFIALFAVAIILCITALAYAIPDFLSSTEYKANGIVSSAQAYVCQVNFTDINWTSQDRIQLLTGTSSGVNWTQVLQVLIKGLLRCNILPLVFISLMEFI